METIFFISHAVGSNLLFDSIKLTLPEHQRAFHSSTLSEAINHLKDYPSEINKIVISDDIYNDFTNKKVESFDDFIFVKEKLSLFIDPTKHTVKWCYLIDAPYYSGNEKEFMDYCSKNQIEFVNVNYFDVDSLAKFLNN